MIATINYGPVVQGTSYRLIKEGYKCKLLSVRGQPVWVPDYVLSYTSYNDEDEDT